MQKPMKNRQGEKGNVLIYILIAVVLIAALSYAVASSNRSSGNGLDTERLRMAATEILEYTNVVSNAVTQLRLRGCTDTQISFENTVSATNYSNGNAPANDSCDVFSVAGGGVHYLAPRPIWLDSTYGSASYYSELFFSGTSCVTDVGPLYGNCTTAAPASLELIMYIPYITRDICIELNRVLKVGPAGNAPPVDSNHAWATTNPNFRGSYTSAISLYDTANGYLRGKTAGCFEGQTTPNGGFHFYKVLIAR